MNTTAPDLLDTAIKSLAEREHQFHDLLLTLRLNARTAAQLGRIDLSERYAALFEKSSAQFHQLQSHAYAVERRIYSSRSLAK